MFQKTDVFVIGGGPAGLAAAIAARRKGFSVTLADGARPPIDKACGEGLLPDTIAALRELGVMVSPSEGYRVRGIRFLGRDTVADATFPDGDAIGMRRPVLHQKLVERATTCGVSLLWNTPVAGITAGEVKIPDGVASAKWIIGADGIGSRVRKWAGLATPAALQRRYAVRRHYSVTPWTDLMEIYWGNNAQAYVTPVDHSEVCVVVISRDPGMRFDSIQTEFPKLGERLKSAKLAGTERGAITTMQKLDRVYSGNVALIGDASGSVDAITGEGLRLGFRQAVALAESLQAGDLGLYQSAHRETSRRPLLMGRLMLLLDRGGSLRERTIRALASDDRVFSRLLAVHVGATSRAHLAVTGALLGWRFVAA